MEELLKGVKCFLLDLDGTVYIDGDLIGDMKNTLAKIRASGRKVVYLTNNSSRSVKDYIKRLKGVGIFEETDEVYSSSIAATEYLKENFKNKKVYLVGTNSLREEFIEAGITLEEETPDIVALGFDTELTYAKLAKATRFLNNGAYYLATHPDVNCPAKDSPLPDIGSFMKLIEASTGRLPDVICGKPYQNMGRLIKEHFSLKSNEIMMVGDRLYTDIMFGINNNFKTLLVYSGETDEKMYNTSGITVTLALNSLNEIDKYL